jgi:hypothetical protein
MIACCGHCSSDITVYGHTCTLGQGGYMPGAHHDSQCQIVGACVQSCRLLIHLCSTPTHKEGPLVGYSLVQDRISKQGQLLQLQLLLLSGIWAQCSQQVQNT